mmetsp:Transcript_47157/g.112225  ORF Transcript_47157/g.112225 Transcript_47157/m.112225 type:complete len:224 (+) Transcript_47157:337-1008(+)
MLLCAKLAFLLFILIRWVDLPKLCCYTLAAKHGVEEAHGQRPLLCDADEGETFLHPLVGLSHLAASGPLDDVSPLVLQKVPRQHLQKVALHHCCVGLDALNGTLVVGPTVFVEVVGGDKARRRFAGNHHEVTLQLMVLRANPLVVADTPLEVESLRTPVLQVVLPAEDLQAAIAGRSEHHVCICTRTDARMLRQSIQECRAALRHVQPNDGLGSLKPMHLCMR